MSSHDLSRDALVLYLLTRPGHTSAEEIARDFGVSTKTVYRRIQEINTEHPGSVPIESRRGIGFRLADDARLVPETADHAAAGQLRPADRRRRILRLLLDEAPHGVDMSELCSRFAISEPQLRADARTLQHSLSCSSLQVVQRNHELSILGSENQIRDALSDVLRVAAIGSLQILGDDLPEAERRDMDFAHAQTALIGDILGSALPSPYDVNLTTHLFVLMARERHQYGTAAPNLPRPLHHEEPVDEDLWGIAVRVRDNVQLHLGRQLADIELDYIYAYLASSRLLGAAVTAPRLDQAERFTRELAEDMGHRLGVHLAHLTLVEDLCQHVRPMLNRLRYGLRVTNPVLDQVREAYPDLLAELAAACASTCVAFGVPEPSLDEVAYIALYFARELELRATTVRALIACASGIGTAELLRVKVCRAFPEIEVVDVASVALVSGLVAAGSAIDLVITTVDLPHLVDVPVVVVDAMFSPEGRDRVRTALRQVQ